MTEVVKPGWFLVTVDHQRGGIETWLRAADITRVSGFIPNGVGNSLANAVVFGTADRLYVREIPSVVLARVSAALAELSEEWARVEARSAKVAATPAVAAAPVASASPAPAGSITGCWLYSMWRDGHNIGGVTPGWWELSEAARQRWATLAGIMNGRAAPQQYRYGDTVYATPEALVDDWLKAHGEQRVKAGRIVTEGDLKAALYAASTNGTLEDGYRELAEGSGWQKSLYGDRARRLRVLLAGQRL